MARTTFIHPDLLLIDEDNLAEFRLARQEAGIHSSLVGDNDPDDAPVSQETAIVPTTRPMDFVLGGKAYFTIKSHVSGKHYTYKAVKPKNKDMFHVSILKQDEAGRNYEYLGTIFADSRRFVHGRRSMIDPSEKRAKAFTYFWTKALAGPLPETISFYHMNKCCVCGRALTDPESITRGIGPECNKRFSHWV